MPASRPIDRRAGGRRFGRAFADYDGRVSAAQIDLGGTGADRRALLDWYVLATCEYNRRLDDDCFLRTRIFCRPLVGADDGSEHEN